MILWALYKVLLVLLLLANVLALVSGFPPGVSCEGDTGMHTSENVLAHLAGGFMCQKIPPELIHQLIDHITAILTCFQLPPLSITLQPALDAVRKYASMASHIADMFPKIWLEGVRGEIQKYQNILQTCWHWLGALMGLLSGVFESALERVSMAASRIVLILSDFSRFLGNSSFSSRIVSLVRIPLESTMGLRVAITLLSVGIFLLSARSIPWAVKPLLTRVSGRKKKADVKPHWERVDNWRTEYQKSQDMDTNESDEKDFFGPQPRDAWLTPRKQAGNFNQKLAEAQEIGGVTKWVESVHERFVWFVLGGLVVWVVQQELELRSYRLSL